MRLHLFIATMLYAVPASLAFAQELAPARKVEDNTAIDAAWSTAWDNHLHSGAKIRFSPPSETDIPDNEFGAMVREGLLAFRNPRLYAADYVGNDLACTSCHLDDGRRAGAAPMWGAYPTYPKFRGKNKRVNTMEMRIQGCFRYSMNGTPPEADSPLMTSYLAYFSWLSQGAAIGGVMEGAGFDTLPAPAVPPSRENGKVVYDAYCVVCHQADGQGVPEDDATGWIFPPLWGAGSYNWGAGMQDPAKAAAFIKKNMPFGLKNQLSDQQAWDVAVYVNSHERPQDPRFTGDVAETRALYHSSTYNQYGLRVDGEVLGMHRAPSGRTSQPHSPN